MFRTFQILPRCCGSSCITWHMAVTMRKRNFRFCWRVHGALGGSVGVLPISPGCHPAWLCSDVCALRLATLVLSSSSMSVYCLRMVLGPRWLSASRTQARPTCVLFPSCPVSSYISKLPSQYFQRQACIEQLARKRDWAGRDSPSSSLLTQACLVNCDYFSVIFDRLGPAWYFHSSVQLENKGFIGIFYHFIEKS